MACSRLVILPGMDGTGFGLDPFISALGAEMSTDIVRYPVDKPLGYSELVDFVRPRLPVDEPYILLGESFSGPIALKLAAEQPQALVGVVLAASFARISLRARPIAKAIVKLGSPRLIPSRLLAAFLLGRSAEFSAAPYAQKRVANGGTSGPKKTRAGSNLC